MAKKRIQSKSEQKRLAVLTGKEIESVFNEQSPSHKAMVEQHEKVQRDIANLPVGQRNAVRSAQALIEKELDEMNDLHFSDKAFEADRRSKAARDLEHRLPVGRITVVSDEIEYGKKVLKVIEKNVVIKTPFNTVIPAQQYVDVLQDNILGLTKELDKLTKELLRTSDHNYKFKALGFVGLIKLAFTRLINKGEK